MAKKADEHFKKRFDPDTRIGYRQKLRYALEVRHPSFSENSQAFLKLLEKYNIAVVCADAAKKWPYFEERTANFAYARLHGGSVLYASQYTSAQLKHWEKIARKWRGRTPGHEVFIYFDNDAKVHAPFDAMNLQKKLA
jgi:uncharacterized protein YecE (DUF72 family)